MSYTVLLSSAGTGALLILLAHGVENTERGLWKDCGTVEAAGSAEHWNWNVGILEHWNAVIV